MYSKKNEEKRTTTPESLTKAMCSALYNFYSSKKTPDFLSRLKEYFKKMLENEHKNNPGHDVEYNHLYNLVDEFFRYIEEQKLPEKITNGKTSQAEFEENALMEIASIPKRKYDMRDLNNPDLIMNANTPQREKNISIKKSKGVAYKGIDKNGNIIIITEMGEILYQDWRNATSYLHVYNVEKHSDGVISNDLVCSEIIIQNMYDPKYREAVLEELLSQDNIQKSNVGSYIGRIVRREKESEKDIRHSERQDNEEYSYRINDEYVLVYDATEVSAIVALQKYNKKKKEEKDQEKRTTGNENKASQVKPEGPDLI